jgi:hypothetical protein
MTRAPAVAQELVEVLSGLGGGKRVLCCRVSRLVVGDAGEWRVVARRTPVDHLLGIGGTAGRDVLGTSRRLDGYDGPGLAEAATGRRELAAALGEGLHRVSSV